MMERDEKVIDEVVGDCVHFPQRIYEWKEAGGLYATCAKCSTDYLLVEMKGVTVNGVPLYAQRR